MTVTQIVLQVMPLLAPILLAYPERLYRLVEASSAAGIPWAYSVAVCDLESGLGRAVTRYWCGVLRPGDREQPQAVAESLAADYRICRSWPRALAMFRWGSCTAPDRTGYIRNAMALSRRMQELETR